MSWRYFAAILVPSLRYFVTMLSLSCCYIVAIVLYPGAIPQLCWCLVAALLALFWRYSFYFVTICRYSPLSLLSFIIWRYLLLVCQVQAAGYGSLIGYRAFISSRTPWRQIRNEPNYKWGISEFFSHIHLYMNCLLI